MQKAPVKGAAKPQATIKPASTTNSKSQTKNSSKTAATSNIASNAVKKSSNSGKSVKSPANNPQKPPKIDVNIEQVQEVQKMKVETINLIELLKKIEQATSNNRSILLIDKLQQNDSTVFFKYKGNIVDIPQMVIKEQMNTQNREKSIEDSRRQLYFSLQSGSTLVFFLDKMQYDLTEFYKDAPFFSPRQLFVPEEVRKKEYYEVKALKDDENVDGFGNKGNFKVQDKFSALVLSKSTELSPDELIKKLNLSTDLFDCIIIE